MANAPSINAVDSVVSPFYGGLFAANSVHGAGDGGDLDFRGREFLLRACGNGALFPRPMAGATTGGPASAHGQNRGEAARTAAGPAGNAGAGHHVRQRSDFGSRLAHGVRRRLAVAHDGAGAAGPDVDRRRGFPQNIGRAPTGTLGLAGELVAVDFSKDQHADVSRGAVAEFNFFK